MTEDEALKAAYLAGFNASGEGYNGEYPFHGAHPEQDAGWIKNRDNEITAIKQARALDKTAENARELGLDYEPVTTLFGSLPVYDTTPPAAQQEYERGVIDGRQMQAQSSVDKAVNAMSQRQFVGLTDKQMVDAIEPLYQNRATAEMAAKVSMDEFRAIEAKLRSNNK